MYCGRWRTIEWWSDRRQTLSARRYPSWPEIMLADHIGSPKHGPHAKSLLSSMMLIRLVAVAQQEGKPMWSAIWEPPQKLGTLRSPAFLSAPLSHFHITLEDCHSLNSKHQTVEDTVIPWKMEVLSPWIAGIRPVLTGTCTGTTSSRSM